jgi:putative FmdB family regulatory protein
MPIYDYKCNKCGAISEHIVKNDKVKVACKGCGGKRVKRMVSAGTNFKLMGRGWPSGGG